MPKLGEIRNLMFDCSRQEMTFSNQTGQDINGSELLRNALVDYLGDENLAHHRLMRTERGMQIFNILEEIIEVETADVIKSDPFFAQFVDFKDVTYGDTNRFHVEDKTNLIVSELADGTWDMRRQILDVGDSFMVETRTYGVAVVGEFLRFVSGRERMSWGELINKISVAFQRHIANMIYVSFQGASEYLPVPFKVSGTLSEDELMDLVSHVEAETNRQVSIVGTKKALRKLNKDYYGADKNGMYLSEDVKRQMNLYGLPAYWEGVPLMEIPQSHRPGSFEFLLDDNMLMVIPLGTKPIKLVREGDTEIREISNGNTHQNRMMEYKALMKLGVNVVFDVYYGAYEVSK